MSRHGRKLRILISVTKKEGIEKFEMLVDLGLAEIISTGKTALYLEERGVPCTPVEDITQFPEMLDGRVKTLHPKIHAGILADRNKLKHMSAIAEHGIEPIDIVVSNLYDFRTNPDVESIDVGGPTLLRAAAKNHESVVVLCDPDDYEVVVDMILTHGHVSLELRRMLALKVFNYTAGYDRMIADWMKGEVEGDEQ